MKIVPKLYHEKETSLIHCDGVGGNDFTLCGCALDNDITNTVEVKDFKISCGNCLAIIDYCKTISYKVMPK